MFQIIKQSDTSLARLGEMTTNHGIFKTPVFMPPGTQATVKALGPDDLNSIGVEIILVNAFHLHLRPGEDFLQTFGGIHRFMGWSKPILSDSGGFQAWSFHHKANLSRISEEGVEFVSPYDGTRDFFTPEKALEAEHKIGSDIIMTFDECAPDNEDKEYAQKALERTNRWAERSLRKHQELSHREISMGQNPPLLFGIIQGGIFSDLRKEGAKFLASLPFDGFALGGETIGYNMKRTLELLEELKPLLPSDKPLYTMGLGANPFDVLEVVKRGVDMFDCVNPARIARHGGLYNGELIIQKEGVFFQSEFKNGILKLANSRFKNDNSPIDNFCDCYTCRTFSRAYLRHLYFCQEPLYLRLATLHNLRFMMRLVQALRDNI